MINSYVINSVIVINLSCVICISLHFKWPETKENFKMEDHLKIERIKKLCENRKLICESKDASVCAVRLIKNKMEYMNADNSCYLFMKNMCEYPGKEFSIVSSGTCLQYQESRRSAPSPSNVKLNIKTTGIPANKTAKPIARSIFSTLYEVDTAFDYHVCPLSCPDVYSPVCVGVNRGNGMYFKFFTFVNHCEGDLYYCKHWQEFSPPPDEDEKIMSSPLSWSFCAANRYIQFARFAEMTSSLGHYGWLSGDFRPSHIMEPHQRKPGYG